MEVVEALINDYFVYIIIALFTMLILTSVMCIIIAVNLKKLKKRYDFFMGSNRKPEYSLECKLNDYAEKSNEINKKYNEIVEIVKDIDKNVQFCSQKIGIVRYNPFEEMGGKLSFAVAILDGHDNGVVFNGIHSRGGSFTYAKPIEIGVSTYILSDEEKEAVEQAKNSAHESIDKTLKVEKKIKIYKVSIDKNKKIKAKIEEVIEDHIISNEEELKNINPSKEEKIKYINDLDELDNSNDDELSNVIVDENKDIKKFIVKSLLKKDN